MSNAPDQQRLDEIRAAYEYQQAHGPMPPASWFVVGDLLAALEQERERLRELREAVAQQLNLRQTDGRFHPYTCPNRGDGKHEVTRYRGRAIDLGMLVASADGWSCPSCDYTQPLLSELAASEED